jgi:hypothetical protein
MKNETGNWPVRDFGKENSAKYLRKSVNLIGGDSHRNGLSNFFHYRKDSEQ